MLTESKSDVKIGYSLEANQFPIAQVVIARGIATIGASMGRLVVAVETRCSTMKAGPWRHLKPVVHFDHFTQGLSMNAE